MASTSQMPRIFPESEYLAFFIRATEALGQSLDYRQTLHNVAAAGVTTIADICIIDIGKAGETELAGAAQRDPEHNHDLQRVERHLESEPDRPIHPVCQVLKSAQTFYAPHIDDAWIDQHASCAEHAEFMRRMRYTSMIIIPLVSQVYGVAGALTLVTTAGGHAPYHTGAVTFAEALGRMCSAAIGKARLFTEAHATATTFQQAALPRIFPEVPGVQFFSYYEPAAKGLLVGGDWYDAFFMRDGRIGVTVGDVSGHGLQAASMMASIRNALRTALLMEPDIGRALDTVDHLFRTEYGGETFCTASLAIIDPDAMTLRLGSAGHPGPKIWDRAAGALTDPFVERDLPLGLRDLSAKRSQPRTIRLSSGLVVFYTDGLTECKRAPLSGERELDAVLRRAAVREADDPARAIRDAMMDCEHAPDDIAILVARFE